MKKIIPILIIVIFIVGLSVLLYPTVSAYINSLSQTRAVAVYYENIVDLDETEFEEMLEAAHAYNKRLLKKKDRYDITEADHAEYLSLLNPKNKGVMGVLEIGIINVKLPIYHGTNESVLQVGIGHLEGSSLPVGGEGTHSIITGHRGLPSSTLLTHLDKMKIGDTFKMTILNQVLTYEVDQIITVWPHETEALSIELGKDYCTLLTCTPYSINTHRIFVRGHRIPNIESVKSTEEIIDEAQKVSNTRLMLIIGVPVVLLLSLFTVLRIRKIYRKKHDTGNKAE